MTQKKKPNRAAGKSSVRSGVARSGSRKSKSAKKTGAVSKKSSSKKSSSNTSSPKKAAAKTTSKTDASKKQSSGSGAKTKDAPKTRTQPSQKKLTTETAPSLGQAPRRRSPTKTASDAPKKDPPTVKAAAAPAHNASQTKASQTKASQAKASQAKAPQPADDSRFSDPYPSNPLDVDMLGIGSPLFPPGGFDLTSATDGAQDVPEGQPWADDPSVENRIREIEERLDGLMASEPHADLDVGVTPEPEVVAPTPADTAVDAAREVLESEYYRKKWGRTSLRERTNEVDDFGLDPDYEEKLRPALDFLFKKYFRVEVEGIRNVPDEGRGVVVANHSGALPFDGVMLREAIRQRHSGRADMRWLAEDFSFYLPFLGVTLNRIGAVRACPENAERLLAKEHLVGVFPEGAEGTKKLYKNRYRLQRFGRGGFVRLCLKTQSPIIPCAIIGAEETNPILYRFDNLSKLLGLDYLPVTPTFPFLGPLGLVPAPTKWKIVFGEPISVAEYGPQAAHDHVLVGRLSERVRSAIGDLLETALRRRKSVWL